MKISPHKCQFFKKKIVYTGLEFQVEDGKVCYTPLKDKCKAIQNLHSPKTLKQTKKFKWTEEAEKAFNDIKQLLVNPPILKAPTPDGLF